MSIDDEFQRGIEAGEVSYLELSLPSDPVARVMLVHRDFRNVLDGPWADTRAERRFGRLRADLERFVIGGAITMSLHPREHRTAYMGLLEPPRRGIFDIRSRDPKPGIRVFGGFPRKDVFAAMHYEFRSKAPDWSAKEPIAGNEHRWQWAIHECETRWKKVFSQPPLTGAQPSDFITTDAIAV